MANFSVLLSLVLLFVSAILAHEACLATLNNDPYSFTDGTQHADCDYVEPTQTPSTDQDYWTDRYWVNLAHEYAIKNMPTLPFGAVLVDSRTNTSVSIGSNMFNSEDPLFGQLAISHAETVVMTNATIHSLPDFFNQTTKRKRAHADWKFMTLYGNIETCPMCAMAGIWRGIRRYVFGARASQLQAQRCWTQPTLTMYEVVDHSVAFAPAQLVRGPIPELENKIVLGFSNQCKTPTSAPTQAPAFTCSVDYTIRNQPPSWPSGMTAEFTVQVSDTSKLLINGAPGWNMTFYAKGTGAIAPFTVQAGQRWGSGGFYSAPLSGNRRVYSFTNANYNAQDLSNPVGFNADTTLSSPYNNICGFSLNGVVCSVANPSTTYPSC